MATPRRLFPVLLTSLLTGLLLAAPAPAASAQDGTSQPPPWAWWAAPPSATMPALPFPMPIPPAAAWWQSFMPPLPFMMNSFMMNPFMMNPFMGWGFWPGIPTGIPYVPGTFQGSIWTNQPLTIESARANLDGWFRWTGNHGLRVGNIAEDQSGHLVADVLGPNYTVIDRLDIDRATGQVRSRK